MLIASVPRIIPVPLTTMSEFDMLKNVSKHAFLNSVLSSSSVKPSYVPTLHSGNKIINNTKLVGLKNIVLRRLIFAQRRASTY